MRKDDSRREIVYISSCSSDDCCAYLYLDNGLFLDGRKETLTKHGMKQYKGTEKTKAKEKPKQTIKN